jgi:hypothetical protein
LSGGAVRVALGSQLVVQSLEMQHFWHTSWPVHPLARARSVARSGDRHAQRRAWKTRLHGLQALSVRLEDTVSAYSSSVADAERLLASKDSLLRKYRHEARSLASKLQCMQVCSEPVLHTMHGPHNTLGLPKHDLPMSTMRI